ncbi:TPR-like protein [Rickenella mellea]|uniref:TPR-like protein n=1 Tax=Rickenella mellea TaxID=50990 RepID=A0A4Y7QNE0_9AGAM|nr:TPR-like protein [Rickenella mellea]
MSERQQQLVLAIIDFLNQSIHDGTVRVDDRDGLEVAIQCIGEAFNVDPLNTAEAEKLSIKPATLQSIFDVFLKTRDRVGSKATPAPTASTSKAPVASSSSDQGKNPTPEQKAEAEKLKQSGNALMSSKLYDKAIDSYSKAISLDSTNAVYYSNRAAAYSSKGDHESAISDAEKAIEVDSHFSKAYHRLGWAHTRASFRHFIDVAIR